MKILFATIVLLLSSICFGQNFLRTNEQLIISFQTNTRKQVYLVKDKSNKYISYRFGIKDEIEFEYPSTEKGSLSKFAYSYYLRGGGTANEGMDLNYMYFTNNGFQYVIYHTYYAVGNKRNIEVKVIDMKTKKIVDVKGNNKTRKGTFVDFRDNGLMEIGEELFD